MTSITAYNVHKDVCDEIEQKYKVDVRRITDDINEDNVDENADIFIVRYTHRFIGGSTILSKAKKLKYLLTTSTGVDHIDIDYCKNMGIKVINCTDYAKNAVAELAVCAAFFGLRNIYAASIAGKKLDYSNNYRYLGQELYGKTCGVMGTGKIGSCIAEKLISLGCNVIAYDILEKDELKAKGIKYVPLNNLLKNSDIIFLALPLTKSTFHIIDDKTLQNTKDGCSIINVGRGELIDNFALYNNIGRIGFAVLDVVEGESEILSGNASGIIKQLAERPNVYLFPHIGARTKEAEINKKHELIEIIGSIINK